MTDKQFMVFNPYFLSDSEEDIEKAREQNNIAPKGTGLYEHIHNQFVTSKKIFDPKEQYIFNSVFVALDYTFIEPLDRWISVSVDFAFYAINSKEILHKILNNIPDYDGKCSQEIIAKYFYWRDLFFSIKNDWRRMEEAAREVDFFIRKITGLYFECMKCLGITKDEKWDDLQILPSACDMNVFLSLFLEIILNMGTFELPESWQQKRKLILGLHIYVLVLFQASEKDLPNEAYFKVLGMHKTDDLLSDLVQKTTNNVSYKQKVDFAPNYTKMHYRIKDFLKNMESNSLYIYGDTFHPDDSNKKRIIRIDSSIVSMFNTKSSVEELQKAFDLKQNNKMCLSEKFHIQSLLENYIYYVNLEKIKQLDYIYMEAIRRELMEIYENCANYFQVSVGFNQSFFHSNDAIKFYSFPPNTYLCMMLEVLLNIGSNVYLQDDADKVRFLHTLDKHLEVFAQRGMVRYPTAYKNVFKNAKFKEVIKKKGCYIRT